MADTMTSEDGLATGSQVKIIGLSKDPVQNLPPDVVKTDVST